MSKAKTDLVALVAYTISSIIFTYPISFSKNEIAGTGGDGYWFLWVFWWFKTALLNFKNPYHTTYIYYPNGADFFSTDISQFNSIISVPLQLAFGLTNAYNIIWIGSFILSGYGTFLLVRYLTGNSKAAFISGLIFMFCPYRFAHALGHVSILSTEWIPFFVLFLIKMVEENKILNSIYAALFLFITATSSEYYLIYMLLFIFIYFLYSQWIYGDPFCKNLFKKFFTMIFLFSLAFAPFIYPVIKEIIQGSSAFMYYPGYFEYSADLLGFLIPSTLHPVFKQFVSPIYNNFPGNIAENTVFIGYITLILVIIALKKVKIREVKFWTLSAVIYFILSLGPFLHVNGITSLQFRGFNLLLPLPYSILMHIPVFSIARVTSRWDVLLMLSLAVLSGYGLKYIFYSYRKVPGALIFFIISSLILFEFLSIPYPTASGDVPLFYKQIAREHENYAIIEIPNITPIQTDPTWIYYQIVHKKKLINGFVNRPPTYIAEFLGSMPLINLLTQIDWSTNIPKIGKDIINQNLTEIGAPILNYYDIKYIILHSNSMTEGQLDFANKLLKKTLKEDPLDYKNESMIVYKINRVSPKPFATLGNGFYDLENSTGILSRWMQSDATLRAYSSENLTVNVSLLVTSFYRNRTLEIYKGDDLLVHPIISPSNFMNITISVHLSKGENLIRFHVPEGCERPSDKPELGNPDSRYLSLTFRNISLER